MIDHSGINVSDFEKSKSFYETIFAPLGASFLMQVPPEHTGGVKVGGFGVNQPSFWISEDQPHQPPLHFAFTAPNRTAVDEFYKLALEAGAKDNGPPGPRPHYHENYYGAFVLDRDGNNIEAVCHLPE